MISTSKLGIFTNGILSMSGYKLIPLKYQVRSDRKYGLNDQQYNLYVEYTGYIARLLMENAHEKNKAL
jgi:hypothetical protein